MSFDGLLTERASISRRATGTDRLGQPFDSYSVITTGAPCRVTQGAGTERLTETIRDAVGETYRIYLLSGTDVREADRVSVTNAAGTTLIQTAHVKYVRVVQDGDGLEHHREADLQVLRSGEATR